MKNKSNVWAFVLMTALASCSSNQYKTENPVENRTVASKNFECSFSDVVDGIKTQFIFIPENLKLSMSNDQGQDVIALEEDNFLSGGFSYVMDKKEKVGQWSLKKIEFISYATQPKVTINFERTPASKKEKVISHFCD